MARQQDRHKIIVGVDFGTTFTGVSFVSTAVRNVKSISDIDVVADWPTTSGNSQEVWKTPTRLALASENGTGRKKISTDRYGFQVEPGLKSYSWFKLGLDKGVPITEFDDPDFKSLEKSEGVGLYKFPPGWSAVDTCAEYLRHIYTKTMEVLERRFTKDVLEVSPIEFWVTVPAIWSDKAKLDTRQAATKAGFATRTGDKICMIPEPEAAAISAISDIGRGVSGNHPIKPGAGVLICDCGGGTVDLTCYRVKQMVPQPEFEELVVGIGGKCGSTYVDRKFHRWISSMFGEAFDNLPFTTKGPGSRLMTAFEDIKRNFNASGSMDEEFSATLVFPEDVRKSLPSTRHYDVEEATIIFWRSEMIGFFQPATDRIIELIEFQVKRAEKEEPGCPIKVVVLVGGFGGSGFLFAQIQKWCEVNGNIQLLCPLKPQAAIVRGAALRGLQGLAPVSRKCRRHYGFEKWSTFRDGLDPESLAAWSEWDGGKRCRDRLDWQIKQGQKVDKDTLISSAVYRTCTAGTELSGTINLYASDLESPPEYTNSPGAHLVGSIHYSIRDLCLDELPSKKRNGRKIWKVKYHVQVLLGHEDGLLAFRIMYKGEEVGVTNIQYVGSD